MLNRSSEFQSLDDVLNATYAYILSDGKLIKSKRGGNLEITNFSASLTKPRSRTSMSLDRKLVKSKFAEFAWYLSKDKSTDYITPYISAYNLEEQENKKILGAYGPKIFGAKKGQKSQFERIINQISLRKTTKQAYLSLSDVYDYKLRDEKYASPPCTIGLHFFVRENQLNLTTYMRSNDAYFGLPHDLFCFTMLQELISCRTNIPLGNYTHVATSMHIYEEHLDRVDQYLNEGLHEPIEMPAIKNCDIQSLNYVSKEFDMNSDEANIDHLDDYWTDYVLFSSRHYNSDTDKELWKKQFKNQTMRLIALNSTAI